MGFDAANMIKNDLGTTFGEYGMGAMSCGSDFDASALCTMPNAMEAGVLSRQVGLEQAAPGPAGRGC